MGLGAVREMADITDTATGITCAQEPYRANLERNTDILLHLLIKNSGINNSEIVQYI
jgi:hypothetical protein